jgi:hypothetical protein
MGGTLHHHRSDTRRSVQAQKSNFRKRCRKSMECRTPATVLYIGRDCFYFLQPLRLLFLINKVLIRFSASFLQFRPHHLNRSTEAPTFGSYSHRERWPRKHAVSLIKYSQRELRLVTHKKKTTNPSLEKIRECCSRWLHYHKTRLKPVHRVTMPSV